MLTHYKTHEIMRDIERTYKEQREKDEFMAIDNTASIIKQRYSQLKLGFNIITEDLGRGEIETIIFSSNQLMGLVVGVYEKGDFKVHLERDEELEGFYKSKGKIRCLWGVTGEIYISERVASDYSKNKDFKEQLDNIIMRYSIGDWGDSENSEDYNSNERAIRKKKEFILGDYKLGDEIIAVKTEQDRTRTTVCYLSEY